MQAQTGLNFLVVIFDSLAEADLSAQAEDLPAIARLRQSGVTFSNTLAPSPESGPARASLMTGLDMAAHGVWTDGVALPNHEMPFPLRFADSGYRTWAVGRRQLAGVSNWTTEHARPGEYHHFDWAHGPLHRSRQNAYLTWLHDRAPDTFAAIFPRQPDPDSTDCPADQYEAMAGISDDLGFNTWVGARVRARLSEHDGTEPFLGIAGFVVGETLGGAPHKGAVGEKVNPSALRQADAALAGLMQQLEVSGMADNTVIVLTAARGSGSGPTLHDTAIRVPLTVCVPGADARTVNGVVSNIDVAPTLYDIAGIAPPQRVQGMPLLAEHAVSRDWMLSRLRRPDLDHQTALRTARWKLVMTHGNPDKGHPPCYQLYDIAADPNETKDLAKVDSHVGDLEHKIDLMIDARVALEDRTEPRIAMF